MPVSQPAAGEAETKGGDIRVVPGRCHECHVQCAMLVHVHDGHVVKVEGDPRSVNQGTLCARGLATVRNLYHPERLDYPLMRTRPKGDPDPGWVRISWDEALDRIATRLKEIQAEYGGHAIAIGQGTGRYTVAQHLRLKNSLGSPNTLTPSHVCRGPNAAATTLSVGHHLRGDYPASACQVYWGKNEAWAHPAFLMHAVMDNIVERGSKVIVVDPRYEHPLAHKADVYLPVRPGSDAALMLSWMNVIFEEGLYDADFLAAWTNGPALVYADTLELVKEGDVYSEGEKRDFLPYPDSVADRRNRRPLVVWDETTGSPRRADDEGTKPALFGTFDLGGRVCKTVLQVLRERAAQYSPEKAAGICWTGSADKIRQAARLYASSPSACLRRGQLRDPGIGGRPHKHLRHPEVPLLSGGSHGQHQPSRRRGGHPELALDRRRLASRGRAAHHDPLGRPGRRFRPPHGGSPPARTGPERVSVAAGSDLHDRRFSVHEDGANPIPSRPT